MLVVHHSCTSEIEIYNIIPRCCHQSTFFLNQTQFTLLAFSLSSIHTKSRKLLQYLQKQQHMKPGLIISMNPSPTGCEVISFLLKKRSDQEILSGKTRAGSNSCAISSLEDKKLNDWGGLSQIGLIVRHQRFYLFRSNSHVKYKDNCNLQNSLSKSLKDFLRKPELFLN